MPSKTLETNDDAIMNRLRSLSETQTPEMQKVIDGTNVDIHFEENGVTRTVKVNEPDIHEDVQKIINQVLDKGV